MRAAKSESVRDVYWEEYFNESKHFRKFYLFRVLKRQKQNF